MKKQAALEECSYDMDLASLNRELEKAGWRYPLESYPKGSPLTMLALDSHYLWEYGGALIPTVAWLAEHRGRLFDSYWTCYNYPGMDFRQYLDQRVPEYLLLTSRYFDVRWIFMGTRARQLTEPVGSLDASAVFDDVCTCYRRLLQEDGMEGTDTAVILPRRHRLDQPPYVHGDLAPYDARMHDFYYPDDPDAAPPPYPLQAGDTPYGYPLMKGFGKLQFYLWPEVYFRQALGFTDDVEPEQVKALGIRKALLCHVDREKWDAAGLDVEVLDSTAEDDDEWSTTLRAFERWKDRASGVAHGMWQSDKLDPGWLGFMIRNRYMAVYHYDWRESMPTVAELAKATGNRNILGGGDGMGRVWMSWDHSWFGSASTYGVGRWKVPTETGIPSILRGRRYRLDEPEVTPWDMEYSDEYLVRCAEENKIAFCFVWTCTDIAYASGLPVLMDTYEVFGSKCGFSFPLPWIEYYRDVYQKIFTPAYAPWIEPVLYHTGLSNFYQRGAIQRPEMVPEHCLKPVRLSDDVFKTHVAFAMSAIRDMLGEGYLPRGDCLPIWDMEMLSHEHRALQELGFAYGMAHAGVGLDDVPEPRALLAADSDCPALRFTKFDAFPGMPKGRGFAPGKNDPLVNHVLKLEWLERNLDGPATVTTTTDTGGGWMVSSFNLGAGKREATDIMPNTDYSPVYRAYLQNYVAKGGISGRVFPCKPSEAIRYERILRKRDRKTAG